jgi:dolichol kinase
MKKVLPIAGNKFPQKTFAVLALIAFLLTLKPVAEVVKTGAEKLGINFPPLDVFRNVASQINKFALGGMVLLVGLAIGLVGLKVAVVLIAVASIYYAGMSIYNSLVKGVTQNTLPEDNYQMDPKK